MSLSFSGADAYLNTRYNSLGSASNELKSERILFRSLFPLITLPSNEELYRVLKYAIIIFSFKSIYDNCFLQDYLRYNMIVLNKKLLFLFSTICKILFTVS